MNKFIKILFIVVIIYLAIGVAIYLFIGPDPEYHKKTVEVRLQYGRETTFWFYILGWPSAYIP